MLRKRKRYLEAEIEEDGQGCANGEVLYGRHAGEAAQGKRHHLCRGTQQAQSLRRLKH